MEKFKVGDRVKIIKRGRLGYSCSDECCSDFVGKTGTINTLRSNGRIWVTGIKSVHYSNGCSGFSKESLIKIGDPMNKYDNISSRIDALDDGWNKDADDILQEIANVGDKKIPRYYLFIDVNKGGSISVQNNCNQTLSTYFYYHSQCEKMSAFKKSLHWLLDHSDIKDEKTEKIKEIESQIKDLQQKVEELK